jgi:hypothetical protein
VLIWDAATGKPVGGLPTGSVTTTAFSPDGRVLAVVHGGNATRIDLFDVASRSLLRSLARPGTARQIVFSPDGRTLASNGLDRTVLLHEVATGQVRGQIDDLPHRLAGLAFAPDGSALYVAAGDKPLVAYDPLTGRPLRTFDAPSWAVAVSPDGKTVAAYGFKGEVRLMEAATGRELRRWQAQPAPMQQVAFTPDGKRLVSAGQDAAVFALAVPGASELDRQWAELAGADAALAYRAVRDLAGRLPRPDGLKIPQLVAQLADHKTAETAAADLARLGLLAEPELRKNRERLRVEEARARVDKLLDPQRPIAYPNEGLRVLRAVEALGRIGSPAARRVLEQVAADWKETDAGQDAAAVLKRLGGPRP